MARIGPQMKFLASRVRDGDSILSLVRREYTTSRGRFSIQFGYKAVHRAIDAGLIAATYRNGRYTLRTKPQE